MPKLARNLRMTLVLGAAILVTACGTSARRMDLNDVRPTPHRATVVFSLRIDEDQNLGRLFGGPPPSAYAVDLDRYDLERQSIVGGCFSRRDVIEAKIPNTPGPSVYFAFDVPAGAYVLSPFISSTVTRGQAWLVPAGVITYLGEFTRTVGTDNERSSGFYTRSEDRLDQASHDTGLQLQAPAVVQVEPPHAYTCAP